MKHLKLSLEDPRLTAYALNELPEDERAALEAMLAHDPEARAFVEQTRVFTRQMEAALADEPELDLVPRMDVSVAAEESTAPPDPLPALQRRLPEYEATGPKLLRFPQLYFLVGGLAAAGFAVLVVLHQQKPVYITNYYAVDLKQHGASGSVPLAQSGTPTSAEHGTSDVATAPADESHPAATTEVAMTTTKPMVAPNAVPIAKPELKLDGPRKPSEGNAVATTATTSAKPAETPASNGPATLVASNEHPADVVTLSPFSATASPISTSGGNATVAINRDSAASPDASAKTAGGSAHTDNVAKVDPKAPARPYAGSFVSAPSAPVADVGIPHDTGSYAAIRGAIDIGKLPAPELVKIEELLNHDIAAVKAPANRNVAATPAPNQLITTVIEAGEAPWASGHRLVRIGLRAAPGTRVTTAGSHTIIAKDIKVEVEFNPRRVAKYRLIGYERPSSATSKAVSSAWTAGTIEAGRVVTVLFEIVPARQEIEDDPDEDRSYSAGRHLVTEERSRAPAQMLTLRVQYRNADSGSKGKLAVAYVDTGATFAGTSDDFKFAAGVAAYGMILRDSPNRGKATLDNAIAWASAGLAHPGDDLTGGRTQIIDLMRRTRALLR